MLRSEDKQVTAKTRRMVNSRLSNRVCYHWLRCCCRRGCGSRRQLQCLCSGLSERGGQLHLGGVLELQLGIGQWNGIYGLRNGMQCVMEQNGQRYDGTSAPQNMQKDDMAKCGFLASCHEAMVKYYVVQLL